MKQEFGNCRATVMGLGTFGGGIAAARFLAQRGAKVLVTDLRDESQLTDSLHELSGDAEIRFHLGEHRDEDFIDCDLVVASPAVRPGNRFLSLAAKSGVTVTSEMRLFWDRCAAPIIGVTGSNGKSTTAALIHGVLIANGCRAWLGGNIGRSLLPHIDDIVQDDLVILELSSFQLADLDAHRLSPHVAVITNFTPNHLDWHGSLDEYADAKQAILRWQTEHDIAIRQAKSPESEWPTRARSVICHANDDARSFVIHEEGERASPPGADESDFELPASSGLGGHHQRRNAMLAATLGVTLGVPPETIKQALVTYAGLPHRMQRLRAWRGRRFINDSASTTPESTIAAIDSAHAELVVIVGGSEKGCDLSELAAAITRKARVALILGDVRETLVDEIKIHRSESERAQSPITLQSLEACESLADAVRLGTKHSREGDTILFSPGFSSGTMFRNFADRGNAFAALVSDLS